MDRFERLAGALRRIPGLEVRENEPMKRHTTFRIGGPARLMALPRSRKEAAAAVRAATEVGIAPFFLGNGSNLLVADHGYEGFVLKACGLDQVREVNRRQRAEYIIDTSALSTAKLRGEVLRLFGDGGSTPAMSVSVISFGFKYGIPIEADLVFDVRFLPNPYYIAELRHQTGLDEGVYSFVFGYQQTKDFMAHLESLIGFLLPQYVEEGKAALVIGIGCTGGQHRSVAITKALADFIKQKGYQATENHRDMTRA